jgi:hypothetical protein
MRNTPRSYKELLQNFKNEVIEAYEAGGESPETIQAVRDAQSFNELRSRLREENDEGITPTTILLWAWFDIIPNHLSRALAELGK